MPDELFTRPVQAPPRQGTSLRAILGTAAAAFVGGAALIGYLVYDGQIKIDQDVGTQAVAASPAPRPAAAAALAQPSTAATQAAVQGGFDQRLAAMEQRLARLDLQAAAAEGNTARAEGLLVAFAARRAIERGAPLGYLADQLKLRFSAAQPAAVQTVIDAAAKPVTLDQLAGQLDALAPTLSSAPKEEGGWDRLRRELSGLFVVRRDDTPSTLPQNRLDRARLLLRSGQAEAAVAEVERLPGKDAAAAWIANAGRYAAAQKALDLIETAALLDTGRLTAASGARVEQPSPAGPEASTAAVVGGAY